MNGHGVCIVGAGRGRDGGRTQGGPASLLSINWSLSPLPGLKPIKIIVNYLCTKLDTGEGERIRLKYFNAQHLSAEYNRRLD